MSDTNPDPRCPECGGKIGQTATYCMHCSADLTDEQAAADTDGDEAWGESARDATGSGTASGADTGTTNTTIGETTGEGDARAPDPVPDLEGEGGPLLDPDGIVDNTLTALVGIAGGIVVGLVGTFVLLVLTESAWALPFGLLAWLGSTAYLVRRRSVTGAVANTAYAIAIVLLLVPLLAFSPGIEESTIGERLVFFGIMLFTVAIPAAISAGVGYVVSQFVAEPGGEG